MRFKQTLREEPDFLEVAKTDEIQPGKMKSVEVKGVAVLIANVDGKFYAMDDRCGHMNAMLSMGALKGKIVVAHSISQSLTLQLDRKSKVRMKNRLET